ncbi:MAG: MFS transporter [Actinobacteria bacterium]|nr:MFS transporter [Actinomycetota bacterium]
MFRPLSALAAPERARVLLIGVFALSGVFAFSWLARIPSIRDALGLTAAELGAVLLVGSIGALVTVFSGPALLARFGSTRVFATGAVVMTIGFLLVGLGPAFASRWLFGVGILVNGIGGSLLTVPMNVESARIEQAHGRSVIPQFHAAFSAGAVVGSILGAVASTIGVPVVVQFSVVAVATGTLRLVALRAGMVMPASATPVRVSWEPAPARVSQLAVWTEPRSILIGVVAFAAALSEGAANNWLALAFVDGFSASEAFGGIVLGVFIGSMMLVRLLGGRAIDRLGRVAALQLSCLFGVLGVATFGLSSHPQVALVGVALWGAGTALCFPLTVAAVSDEPRRAPARVSMMASLASVAVMTGAPLIGVVAGSLGGARHALLVVLVPLLAALFASRWVAPSLTRVADPLAA